MEVTIRTRLSSYHHHYVFAAYSRVLNAFLEFKTGVAYLYHWTVQMKEYNLRVYIVERE